jgi:3D (Asp-Asp-Asp) domain-containing protein
MKISQIIREEIIPLSRKQNIVLFTIIACIFQFAFFYAPALADEAVQEASAKGNIQETVITNDSVVKDAVMDVEAAKLSGVNDNSITQISTSSPVASSTNPIASSTPKKVDKVIRTSTHTMTAYNSEVGQTDDDPCTTANGFNLCKHGIEDTIAANFLPMGTKVKIPELFGDRIFIVRDRMNQKHPNRVDVWMKDHQSAMNFGVKVAKIQVIE